MVIVLLAGTNSVGNTIVKGYQVWAAALKPIFAELLGPPAKEDQTRPLQSTGAKVSPLLL